MYGPDAVAVTVQGPAEVKVTTPAFSEQAPLTATDGVTPVADPVTAERLATTGVYVPPGRGIGGTDDVNARV